jgi:RimJ/RimL family protein N-acetyltransferase
MENSSHHKRPYGALKKNTRLAGPYSIVPLRREDILSIKKWRNEQIDVLRQDAPLTDEQQIDYFENVVVPSFTEDAPRIMLFSYLQEGRCIGYGGLTNIDWISKRIELSFLLDPERVRDNESYEREFTIFLTMIKDIVFTDLAFNRIIAETYAFRSKHIAVLEKNGFRREGTMRQHVMIQGRYCDSIVHGLLREDYRNVP